MNRRIPIVKSLVLAAIAILILLPPVRSHACSRVFLNDNKIAKIVVRSMDLPAHFPEKPRLVVFPRGMKRDCSRSVLPGVKGKVEGFNTKPLRWTSKYGSVVMVGYDAGVSDGINEKGLCAHLLTLMSVKHEPVDSRPELSDALWVQYVLDNFTKVEEVVRAHGEGKFRLRAVTAPSLGHTATLGSHLAVEDSTGDSAVFEYIDGKLVVHHGTEYRVMTNDPPLDEMLTRMKKYKEFGGTQSLPGDSLEGEYRFARLAAYYKYLPAPKTYVDAVAGAFSLMRIAQVPFRDPEKDKESEPDALWRGCQTNWVSAADLTNRVYYINSSIVPSLTWVELDDLDLRKGSPVLFLNPHNPKLGGGLSKQFKKWKAQP
ncbi:MAG: linear amide C-N hydrolase [Syntrophales bacterium]|nr:linear amide C-N hydrolase [Syntrophales bacterium]